MILLVQSLWNATITGKIVEGAKAVLTNQSYEFELIQVPGALEIPLAIKWANESRKLQGVIACGAVIKGETHHFDIVANESSRALMNLSLDLKIPIGNGILTVYDLEQALERIGGKHGNKGEEAARAVIQMIALRKKLEAPCSP